MTPAPSQYLTANSRVSVEAQGSVPVWTTDASFREALTLQLTMMGFAPEVIQVRSDYGLSARDYRATFTVRTLASMQTANFVGLVRDALEGAGSYAPTVTIPSIGQPSQPELPRSVVTGAIDDIIGGVGSAVKGVGEAPTRLFDGINLIVVGIVVLAALVAFGPNIKDVARAAR